MATVTPVWSMGRSVIRHTENTAPGDQTPIWSYGMVWLAAQTDVAALGRGKVGWLPAFVRRVRH